MPATAAAERRLDRHRPAVLLAERPDLVGSGGELRGAGHDRRAAAQRRPAARHLVAHLLDRRRRRSDERHAELGDRPGEVGVLGEEPVAGMHAVGTAARDGVEDRRGVEVALRGGLATEGVRLVGEPDVHGVAIELGVHGHRGDAELAGGADDAHGDLAAVGDEDLLQHACQCRVRAVPGEHGAVGGTAARGAGRRPAEWPPGWHVEHVAATGSTNDDLSGVGAGAPGPLGARRRLPARRPRSSRSRVDGDARGEPARLDPVPRRAGGGDGASPACVAWPPSTPVAGSPRRPLALKWPNDVLLDDRKLAGVLAQRTASGSVVVGIGVNVGWAPDGASRLGPDVAPAELLAELLAAYDRLPRIRHELRDRYRSELATLGRRVRVELPDGELLGAATDLAVDGRLVVVDDAGTAHRLSVGDVVHLRACHRDGLPGCSQLPVSLARHMSSRGRIHRAPLALAALFTVVVGVGGGAGVYFAGEREEAGIERVEELTEVLAANEGPAENYLIVGSDNRDVIDEDSEDAGLFLDGPTGEGGRSDTIMILRRDPENGASLLSIPRDLWVPIAGTGDDGKINWAYIGGPRRLAETITQALGIPIHHYVEVDFAGFQRLVDEIGGVEICVEYAAQDTNSGLVLQPGCQTLDGAMALAYARSRYYEEFRDGEWRIEARRPRPQPHRPPAALPAHGGGRRARRDQQQPVPPRRPHRRRRRASSASTPTSTCSRPARRCSPPPRKVCTRSCRRSRS